MRVRPTGLLRRRLSLAASAVFTGAGETAKSSLIGTAKTAAGDALEGIVVSARAAGSNITTSVLTDGRGEYVFPPLDSGRYDVWAQAIGYETARAEARDRGGRQAQSGVHAEHASTTSHRSLSGSEWFSAMPEDTKEQRRDESHLPHQLHRLPRSHLCAPEPVRRERLARGVMFMERNTGTGGINRHTTVAHYRDELARYLARAARTRHRRRSSSSCSRGRPATRPAWSSPNTTSRSPGRAPNARGTTGATGRWGGRPRRQGARWIHDVVAG